MSVWMESEGTEGGGPELPPLEHLRATAAHTQGLIDWILDEHVAITSPERPALEEASDELNYQVARIDAMLTGYGTKMLDPEAERARRGKSKRS